MSREVALNNFRQWVKFQKYAEKNLLYIKGYCFAIGGYFTTCLFWERILPKFAPLGLIIGQTENRIWNRLQKLPGLPRQGILYLMLRALFRLILYHHTKHHNDAYSNAPTLPILYRPGAMPCFWPLPGRIYLVMVFFISRWGFARPIFQAFLHCRRRFIDAQQGIYTGDGRQIFHIYAVDAPPKQRQARKWQKTWIALKLWLSIKWQTTTGNRIKMSGEWGI